MKATADVAVFIDSEEFKMEKKNLDWANLGFGYVMADYRYVSNYKDGKWDDGEITTDANITLN